MEGTIRSSQQPTLDTHAQQLSVEEEDLQLTPAPGSGSVEVNNE
jgi:hypothetical protein